MSVTMGVETIGTVDGSVHGDDNKSMKYVRR
jgi:hypothetical protein